MSTLYMFLPHNHPITSLRKHCFNTMELSALGDGPVEEGVALQMESLSVTQGNP